MAKVIDRDSTGRTVLLTRVRASFADSLQEAKLPKKSDNPNAKPTHSSNFLIVPEHDFDANKAVVISALKATCIHAKKPEDWWKRLWDDDPKQLAFRKGEKFKSDAGEVYQGYEGALVVVAKGPRGGLKRPKILDRHKREVAVDDINDVVYNGTLCDVQVSWYYTDKGGTPRITCSAEAVRSHQEGERLGGGGTYVDADDFDELSGDDGFDSGSSTSSADLDF